MHANVCSFSEALSGDATKREALVTYGPHGSPLPHSQVVCSSFHNLLRSTCKLFSCCSDRSTFLISRRIVVENRRVVYPHAEERTVAFRELLRMLARIASI